MYIQRGYAPLHLVLLNSGLTADERLLLLERLLAAGAEVEQTVTDGAWVGICLSERIHVLNCAIYELIYNH